MMIKRRLVRLNKKFTVREKLDILKRSLKLINNADKGHTFRKIFTVAPQIIDEFSVIFLASLVIDGIMAAKPLSYLLTAAVIVCGVTFITNLMGNIISSRANCHNFYYSQNSKRMLQKKVLEIDYTRAEDTGTMNSLQQAQNYMSNGQTGIPAMESSFAYMFYGVFSVIIGVILIAPSLLAKPAGTAGFMGFVQSPWGFLAVMAVTILLMLLPSGVIIPKIINLRQECFKDSELLQADRVAGRLRSQTIYNYRMGKEIRLYDESELLLNKYIECNKIIADKWTECVKKVVGCDGLSFIVALVLQLLLYGFAIARAAGGMMSPGEVIAFVMYFSRIRIGIGNISVHISQILTNTTFCSQVFDFLDIPDEKYQGTIPTEKRDDNEYEFEFKHVYFKYPGSEQYVLKDINLKWRIGEKMALVGKNGCGKSTLVKLLCRLYDPTEGEITLNGIDIKKYKYEDYMALFSVVFQDSKLFSFSMAENVAADTDYDSDRVENCVVRAGLGERLEKMENGINTCMYKDFDEHGVEVSGGEAQKLCLARAVYKGAPFIVLDEPTAALDPVSEHDIYTKFNGIVGTRTAIYISHRLSSCRFCDEITVMEDGKIAERGSHQALLEMDGVYKSLWTAQAEYYKDTAGELFL